MKKFKHIRRNSFLSLLSLLLLNNILVHGMKNTHKPGYQERIKKVRAQTPNWESIIQAAQEVAQKDLQEELMQKNNRIKKEKQDIELKLAFGILDEDLEAVQVACKDLALEEKRNIVFYFALKHCVSNSFFKKLMNEFHWLDAPLAYDLDITISDKKQGLAKFTIKKPTILHALRYYQFCTINHKTIQEKACTRELYIDYETVQDLSNEKETAQFFKRCSEFENIIIKSGKIDKLQTSLCQICTPKKQSEELISYKEEISVLTKLISLCDDK
ncbi:MAG: hypothetical protein ABH827_06185 [bacterium]